ncbi:MAG: transcriptional regulator [Chloroflexi bacterium]|nr:transcriptional regulator [Chloroflexota bacterium]
MASSRLQSESDYSRAVVQLDQLLDEVGDDERYPLYNLLDTLGSLIYTYEEETVIIPESSGVDALRYLMEEHGLSQSNLPEVGSQGVVSEILGGRRELNVRQIRGLADRFGVSPAVFF